MSSAKQLAAMFRNFSTALFGIFIICVVSDNLPLRVLEPSWQFTFAASLVRFVTIAMAGYGFLHLSCYLSPSPRQQDAYLGKVGKMAQMAVIGFLLLIPLIGYSGYSNIRRIDSGNAQQKLLTQRNVTSLVKAINDSATPRQLQAQMVALHGPRISNDALQIPLQTLKAEAISSVKQAQNMIEGSLKGPDSPDYLTLYRQLIRTALLAAVSAFGMASVAWNPRTNQSLLTAWIEAFSSLARGLRRTRIQRSWSKWSSAIKKKYARNRMMRARQNRSRRRRRGVNL